MASYNNSVSDPFKELKGSAKVSVAPYTTGTPSWTNVGAITGLVVKEDLKTSKIEADNTAPRNIVFSQEFTAEFNQTQRLDPALMAIFRAGMDEFTTTAGVLVEDHEQTIASGDWSYNQFILIENQNYDGGIITINSVTLGTNGVIVADTDYYLGQDDQDRYGIFIIDSATVTTEAQSVVIDHDYTPSASFRMDMGGATELPYLMFKFESVTANEDGTAGLNTVVCYRGQQENGCEWTYNKDSAEDPRVINPMSYRFYEDPARIVNSKKIVAYQEWTTSA